MDRLKRVAASSEAWGWLFPTIPKAFGFEAATRLNVNVGLEIVLMKLSRHYYFIVMVLLFGAVGCHRNSRVPVSQGRRDPEQNAVSMIQTSESRLAPVYAPLAEQIAADFNLAEKQGIGIDLGSGPGTLIIELCERTQLHWINADINPHFFPYFYDLADQRGFGGRVSAVLADACALPFRDNYADIIVSRGSFHLWKDKTKAFSEIYRVLKPGGVAYIGRGFPRDLPVATAEKIRAGGKLKYDVEKTADDLRRIMNALKIKEHVVYRPKPPAGEHVNYGVWVEFHKPKEN
jgi:SAM-dependent methyltransferase